LKYYIDFNSEEAGEVEKRLAEKKIQYDKLVALAHEKTSNEAARRLGGSEDDSELLPIGEGSLVIDEVKARSIIDINPRVHNIKGEESVQLQYGLYKPHLEVLQ